jgi:hypothetical protein
MLKQLSSNSWHLRDHGGGFDHELENNLIRSIGQDNARLMTEYVVDDQLRQQYPNLKFEFDFEMKQTVLSHFNNYNIHPALEPDTFICSFNGNDHVSRKLLTASLHRWGWFNNETTSKNFKFDLDILDGHLHDYVGNNTRYYRKFFVDSTSQDFFHHTNSFGHVQYDHAQNIYKLEKKITQSFVHLVSETMATSYYPFVTEKFVYSVVTRGLFLAYAQPGWHDHLEKYFGFRKFDRIFSYEFDSIQNPVERLVSLMSMLSKFSILDSDDWRDLYEMEIDTIEHNYDHYFSGSWIKQLRESTSV